VIRALNDPRAALGRDGLSSADLDDLVRYMEDMIEARRRLAELETGDQNVSMLLDTEGEILRKAAGVRAEDLRSVIGKLRIWEMVAEDDDEGGSLENAVVRSVLHDLRRLDRSAHPGQ